MLFDWIAQMFQTISPCTDDQIFDPIEYLYFIWTNKQRVFEMGVVTMWNEIKIFCKTSSTRINSYPNYISQLLQSSLQKSLFLSTDYM